MRTQSARKTWYGSDLSHGQAAASYPPAMTEPVADVPAVTHRHVQAGGLRMHIAEAGQGPLVLLLHGFPESWYSWRHQLTALAAAGYHAVAPDQRGYCATGPPGGPGGQADIGEYTILHLTGDVIALMDALGEDQAVVAGHDWGAPVAWHTALFRPDRVRGVIGLSVPYRPRGSAPPIATLREALGESFYMVYFQQPGVADAELSRDPPSPSARCCAAWQARARQMSLIPPGGGFLDAAASPGAAAVADSAGHRRVRERIRAVGLHRPAQLVPQHGPQLGAHRRLAARADRRVRACSWPATRTRCSASSVPMASASVLPRLTGSVILPGCGHWTQQETAGRGQRRDDRVPARPRVAPTG